MFLCRTQTNIPCIFFSSVPKSQAHRCRLIIILDKEMYQNVILQDFQSSATQSVAYGPLPAKQFVAGLQ